MWKSISRFRWAAALSLAAVVLLCMLGNSIESQVAPTGVLPTIFITLIAVSAAVFMVAIPPVIWRALTDFQVLFGNGERPVVKTIRESEKWFAYFVWAIWLAGIVLIVVETILGKLPNPFAKP